MSKKIKENKKKGMRFEKFFVCPNCRKPLFRKKTLKIRGLDSRYCDQCGFDYADVIKHTPAGKIKMIRTADLR